MLNIQRIVDIYFASCPDPDPGPTYERLSPSRISIFKGR
jgi:hypothetical protein